MNCYEFIRGLNKKGESRQGRYGKVSFGAGCRAFNPLSSLTFLICPFRGLAWRPCRVSNQPYSELFHTKHMWTMTSCAPIGSMDVAACTRQICLLPACWGHQHLGLCLPATYQTPGVSSHHHTPLHQFASCWGKQVGLWFFFSPWSQHQGIWVWFWDDFCPPYLFFHPLHLIFELGHHVVGRQTLLQLRHEFSVFSNLTV